MIIRKLITKFHDNPEVLKRKIAATAYGFDPHLAERTRAKDPHAYTRDELEWSTVDKVLHPEVWRYYSNYDSSKKFSDADKGAATVSKGPAVSSTKDKKQAALESLGKILHMNPVDSVGASLSELANNAHLSLVRKANTSSPWTCPFDKDTLMKIWRTPRQYLKNDDERTALKHLLKFNGLYSSYMEAIAERDMRGKNAAQIGHHVKWDRFGGTPPSDMDVRCRLVLKEIERARLCTTVNISYHTFIINIYEFG